MNNWQINAVGGGLTGEIFHQIISLENLFTAWREFRRGKRDKSDVGQFEFCLEDNIFALRELLINQIYSHGPYQQFLVRDPKLRQIHKASVRDRVLHQAVYRVLYQIFDPSFIFDSYSCRVKKGVHRGVWQLDNFTRKVSANYRHPAYVLKCDIRKFFDHVDHDILLSLLEKKVTDPKARWLIKIILNSFNSVVGRGLPLGNVTSQLFANIYLNELDQFVKHQLKSRYYLRYCDDFVIIHPDPCYLYGLIPRISEFLQNCLCLELHPQKITLRKLRQGIDYLGYVTLLHYRVLRTKTKRRILRLARRGQILESSLCSFLGLLSHCREWKTEKEILKLSNVPYA